MNRRTILKGLMGLAVAVFFALFFFLPALTPTLAQWANDFNLPAESVDGLILALKIVVAAALVIAALAAKGESTILGAETVDRGYVSVETELSAIGAGIIRK